MILLAVLFFTPLGKSWSDSDSWELDNQDPAEDPAVGAEDSWELDYQDDKSNPEDDRFGSGGDHSPRLDLPRVFVRGDANIDTRVNIADAIVLIRHLFAHEALQCEDAADVNDNGQIELTDPIQLLQTLYGLAGPELSGLPKDPGVDETSDSLDCDVGLDG
jgi:hypothetical protein